MPAAPTSMQEVVEELMRCRLSPHWFIRNHIKIKPAASATYQPFCPYRSQVEVLQGLHEHKYTVLLKARQLGQSTVCAAYALWLARFRQNSTILLFSKGYAESKKLLAMIRMMAFMLPAWMRPKLTTDAKTHIQFDNGSQFVCFGSKGSGGDSWTADLAIVDEADLVDDLDTLLGGIVPTMAAAGKLVLLSRPDKDKSEEASPFKQIFKLAMRGENDYWPKFLPWYSIPGRDQAFYEEARKQFRGSTDKLWEQYPATVEEAFAPRQEAKRIPLAWLEQCAPAVSPDGIRQWPRPLDVPAVLAGLPGLRIYHEPEPGRSYDIGLDLASGKGQNPNLDDSAAVVIDKIHCRQVGVLVAKIEPSIMAESTARLARYFNGARVLVEQNGQYGGAALNHLRQCCPDVTLVRGPHGDFGFNTTDKTKVDLYTLISETALSGGFTITDQQTFEQLASIETATLSAPLGLHDDLAMAFGFALWAAEQPVYKLDVEVADLPGAKPTYQRPTNAECGEGIAYSAQTGDYAITLPPKYPLPRGQKVVNLGNYQSDGEARHAHNHGNALLGRPPVHSIIEGEITARTRTEIERQVREKLVAARQLK